MKRLLFLSLLMPFALNSFAYYGKPELEMPGWLSFMAFIMIVWGILEIILFFKIWGMTDDVKALKKFHLDQTVFESKSVMAKSLRRNLVLGDLEKVKRTLLKNFIDNVETGFSELTSYGYGKDENGNEKLMDLTEQNLKESIQPYIDNLKQQFDKIGEELPLYIQRMETYGDYYKIFQKKDLIVEVEKKSEN